MHPSDSQQSPTTATPAEVGVLVVVAAGSAVGASQTDHAGPILAFVGVLLVAAITWISTDRRQARQLDAEGGHQRRDLDAAQERTALELSAEQARLDRTLTDGRRQQARQLRHARELADLADLRALLDEAAVALHLAGYVLDDVRSTLSAHAFGFFKTEERAKPYRDLESRGKELHILRERLAVRLGAPHEVVAHFTAANAAVLDVYRALGLLKLEPDAQDQAAKQQVRDFMNKTRERVAAQRAAFDEQREAFMDAAQRVAGARL